MLKVLKPLIESADLTIYSYVKPGAIHRYSTKFKDLHQYVCLLTSSLEVYYEATDLGNEVSKGRKSFADVSVGSLIKRALQESKRYAETTNLPEYHLLMIPSVISATYTISTLGYMDVGRYQKAVKSLLMYSSPQDAIDVYDAFRGFPSDLGRALGTAGITPGLIKTESLTIGDLLEEVSKFSKLSRYLLGKGVSVSELVTKFTSTYLDTGDLNSAAVSSYALLLEVSDGIRINPLIKDKKDFLSLLKLDNKLVKEGSARNDLIPVLNEAIFAGLLTFEYPKS